MRLTGDTQGADAFAGFGASAAYLNQVTSPSGAYFNYADCIEERRLQAPLFWLAHRFARPEWLAVELARLDDELATYLADPTAQYGHYDMVALALLWYRPAAISPAAGAAACWQGGGAMPVAVYRGGAEAPFYIAIKGGSVGLSHSHMDVGSFVYERDGVRWAIDLGMQDYESLESAGVDLWDERSPQSERWNVFRIGPEPHNILRFGGGRQRLFAPARFVDFGPQGCEIDLSAPYVAEASAVSRKLSLGADGDFAVEDAWVARVPTTVTFQWLTRAEVSVVGSAIHLRQAQRRLLLEIAEPGTATVKVEEVDGLLRSFDEACPGVRRISIEVASRAGPGRLRIEVRSGSLQHGWEQPAPPPP